MHSEYDPLLPDRPIPHGDDLEAVRRHFEAASRPYLASPWSWLAWALVLPATALATEQVGRLFGASGVLFLWSAAILVGGAAEMGAILRRRDAGSTPLAAWALRVQGNLSLVGLALSVLLVYTQQAWVLPGLWLLLIGHSFYLLGGLSFPPFRTCGVLYQVAGAVALWPGGRPLLVLAAATLLGNAWMALAVGRRRQRREAEA